MKKNLKAFIELLIMDNKDTYREGFSDNDGKRQGSSFEGYLTDGFVETGFKDGTGECQNLHSKSSVLEFDLFGSFKTKRARKEYYRWFKDNLEDNTTEVIETLKWTDGFIEQPCSSKRQPDIFIWWTNEDGSKGWLLIDVKTGGGRGPKLNDREIGWEHLVIFNSSHKTVSNRPTTITFAKDLFPQNEYDGIEKARQKAKKMRQELIDDQKDHEYIQYNFRDRVEIKNKAGNWFVPIRDITREEREQRVIDFLS